MQTSKTDRELLELFLPAAVRAVSMWNKDGAWHCAPAEGGQMLTSTPEIVAYAAVQLAKEMLAELNRRAPRIPVAGQDHEVRFVPGAFGIREATIYVDCDHCQRRYPVHLRTGP